MADTLSCEKFFDGSTLHGASRIDIVDGVVTNIEPHGGRCDAHLISPGLVDLQVNGWDDVDVATASTADLERMGRMLATVGTTAWLGTFVTGPIPDMTSSVQRLDEARSTGSIPGFVGVHIEGPFLGSSPGAHRRKHIIKPDLAWIESLPSSVRLLTIAPESELAVRAIEILVDKGIVASLGHSRPDRISFDAAVTAGARMTTHLFNGMSGIHHRDGGLALWSLVSPKIAYGLIADMVHVAPEAVALALSVDAGARACLVSDSVAWRSPWASARGVRIIDGAPRLPDGTLAGSSTPLAECLRLAVTMARVPPSIALAAATSVPARVIGENDLGRLRVGGPADLVLFDTDLHVVDTRTRLPSARA